MADPGDPAPPAGPAGRVDADPYLHLGSRVPAAHQLPPLSHGSPAPQAGGQPGAAPSSADRTRHGLSLPAVTGRPRPAAGFLPLLTTFPLIGGTRFADYDAKCEARDYPRGSADEGTGR